MTRISRTWLAPLALALLLTPVAARAADLQAQPADPTKYLPNNSTVIGHINIQQLLKAPLLKKEVQEHLNQFKKNEKAQEISKALGIDPSKDLHALTFGAPLSKDAAEKGVAVLSGNFDPDKIRNVAKQYADTHSENLKVTKSGKYTVYEVTVPQQNEKIQLPSTVYVVPVNKSTILAAGSQDVLKQALAKADGEQKTKLSKDMTAGLKAIDKRQDAWVVVEAKAVGKLDIPNARQIAAGLAQFRAIGLGVKLTQGINIRANLTTQNAEVAEQFAGNLERGLMFAPGLVKGLAQQNQQMAPFVDIITDVIKATKVSHKEATVTISVTLTKELLARLEKAAKAAQKGNTGE